MNRLRKSFWATAALRALRLIPANRRRRLVLLVIVQMFLGSLDLVAVLLVGLLGSLSVMGVQSRQPNGLVARVLQMLGMEDHSLQWQVGIIAVLVVLLLLCRTLASIALTRKALHFLALRAAEASGLVARRLLAQPITFVQARATQDLLYAATSGTAAAVLGVLGSIVVMAADAGMLVVLSTMLLVASPIVAIALGILMVLIVSLLHRFSTAKAAELGELNADVEVRGKNLLVEAISTYRDAIVKGSGPRYSEMFTSERVRGAHVGAELTFLPNVSKYVLEAAVVIGALLVGGIEFAIAEAQTAVSVIGIFLAAGTRLAPAIIRVQQGVFTMRTQLGQSKRTFELLDAMPVLDSGTVAAAPFTTDHEGFRPQVRVTGLRYTYSGAQAPAVMDWNLDLASGQMLALVGPSGAGKSTAADLLLGVLSPDTGEVRIADVAPTAAASRWPGAIGFVPQDVWIADGTIRDNVTLGFDPETVPDEAVWNALALASLADHVRGLPDGLLSRVGERGTRLSGGQRQRLGIARALVTRPRFLVLDEATSALDASTEHEVTEAIRRLQGHLTLVVIAHRLATVRHADLVQYFDGGCLVAQGSFAEVKAQVPSFAAQAALLGV